MVRELLSRLFYPAKMSIAIILRLLAHKLTFIGADHEHHSSLSGC
jgi:hypothetical protein